MDGSRGLNERFCWRDRESLISQQSGSGGKGIGFPSKGGCGGLYKWNKYKYAETLSFPPLPLPTRCSREATTTTRQDAQTPKPTNFGSVFSFVYFSEPIQFMIDSGGKGRMTSGRSCGRSLLSVFGPAAAVVISRVASDSDSG